MEVNKNGKYQSRCVSRELAVRLEERLVHFMTWLQTQKNVVPYSLQDNEFHNKKEIEKLIIEYVEG
jgi:hypothetical protein